MVSSFFVRVLLSVFVLSASGRGCGSLRSVWFGGGLCLWGGSVPASAVSVWCAWSLFLPSGPCSSVGGLPWFGARPAFLAVRLFGGWVPLVGLSPRGLLAVVGARWPSSVFGRFF